MEDYLRLFSLWLRDFKVPAYLFGEEVYYFLMSRNGTGFLLSAINVDSVIAALSKKFATVTLDMTNEVFPFHAAA